MGSVNRIVGNSSVEVIGELGVGGVTEYGEHLVDICA